MSVGDAVGDIQSIATGSSLLIQPAAGTEWTIHNLLIPYGKAVEIYFTDGVSNILVDTTTGSYMGFYFHAKVDSYYRLKNISGETILLGYDGVITRATT